MEPQHNWLSWSKFVWISLEKLVDEFGNKFKKEWHSLQVSYKREKAREEESKTSGSGSYEVYYSTWEFQSMEFLDDTANVDESYTSLDSEPYVTLSKKRRKGRKECKIAVMEVFNRIIEVKNAGGACFRTEIR